MGRKRQTTSAKNKSSKNGRKSKKQTKTFSNDMLGGLLVVVGFMFFIFYTFSNIGNFAEIIKSLSFGLFGKAAFLIPLTFVVVGIYSISSDEKVQIKTELKKGGLITFLFAPTLATFLINDFGMFNNFVQYLAHSYNVGQAGVFGAFFASLFVKFIGRVPSQVLLTSLTFISTLCVFNISFSQFFRGIGKALEYVCNILKSAIAILFREEEEKENKHNKYEKNDIEEYEEDVEFDFEEPNLEKAINKKKNKLLIDKEKLFKMKEKGNENPEESLNYDRTEQVEFDFNKLGGKPSEEEIQAKQQRDQFFKKQKEEKEDKSVKEVLTLDHVNHVIEDNYEFPPIDFLNEPKDGAVFDKKAIHATAVKLQKTLASFGVEAKVTNITKGPTVTRYELSPSTGVKVSKIVNLADDIALNLAAKSIRIEAPIPGKAAVGIEVPNSIAESVSLREVIESSTFIEHKSKVAFALGKDAAGEMVVADIAKMPHTLVAGSTGSGKSVCINSILVSLLYKAKPSEVKLMLIDPKMVELSGYNGIPHLLIPVVTDPKKAAGALNWAVQEMVNRYNLFASKGVKDIKGYNKVVEKEDGETGAKLPQIVIIIDELADLMMVAPNDVEDAICRLAQMARAAGMHLIIATQRPSVDVITGIIKANIPSRIAFTVSSQVDSRTILDSAGAEKLLGKGDMLYFPVGETKPLRVQGAFVSEGEIEKIVEYIKETTDTSNNEAYSSEIMESIEKANIGSGKGSKGSSDESQGEDGDALLNDAIDLVVDMGSASASMLQRRFKIGYSRAGRIIDQMEARGLISGYDGSKPRQVLVSKSEWQELKMGASSNTSSDDNVSSGGSQVSDFNVPVQMPEVDLSQKYVASNSSMKPRSKYDIEL